MKSRSTLFIIALILFGQPVMARAAAELYSDTEITVKQITGPSMGMFYGLKWSREGRRCKASQGNPGQPQEWVPIPSRACKGLRDYVLAHHADLEASRLAKTYVYTGTRPGRAYLELGEMKFLISLLTAVSCDPKGVHCKRPWLSNASKLGLELRSAINRELGRLPEWIKPPGAETWGDP